MKLKNEEKVVVESGINTMTAAISISNPGMTFYVETIKLIGNIINLYKAKKELSALSNPIIKCAVAALEATKKQYNTDTVAKLTEYTKEHLSVQDSQKWLSELIQTPQKLDLLLQQSFNIIENKTEIYLTSTEFKEIYSNFFDNFVKELGNNSSFGNDFIWANIKEIKANLLLINENILKLKSSEKEQSLLDLKNQFTNSIISRKRIIVNQSLFPWYDEKKYSDVFPKLFIEPIFSENKLSHNFSEILKLSEEHIAIIGAPGSGKSTLLRYIFAFDKIPNTNVLYITANELDNNDNIVFKMIDNPMSDIKFLVLIDGIDEAFFNNHNKYVTFINHLNKATNCTFWIGCREDYYKTNHSENTSIFKRTLTVNPWNETQTSSFLNLYGEIIQRNDIIDCINKMVDRKDLLQKIHGNPFQLSILAFLAEDKNSYNTKITNIFELYEAFLSKWITNECKRGTSNTTYAETITKLRLAAKSIYKSIPFELDNDVLNNSAIKNLLTNVSEPTIHGTTYATAFYHRSISAFLLADLTIESMLNYRMEELEDLFLSGFKDDVTNFIIDRIATFSTEEKLSIKKTMIALYDNKSTNPQYGKIREQCIYYATRLGIDVSDFLEKIISSNPSEPLLRLSLAYGCVLSENTTAKEFALEYAKSIAAETIDAITNRAWTVVYFGDIVRDPYTYKDDEKCPWTNARKARLTRFTKSNPRKKDYRFRLFDIPLIYSYFKDRNWDNISEEELNILKDVDFPDQYFNEKEREFLLEQKSKLVSDYEEALKRNTLNL